MKEYTTDIFEYFCGEITELKTANNAIKRKLNKQAGRNALLWIGLAGASVLLVNQQQEIDILKAKVTNLSKNSTFSAHYDDEVKGD